MWSGPQFDRPTRGVSSTFPQEKLPQCASPKDARILVSTDNANVSNWLCLANSLNGVEEVNAALDGAELAAKYLQVKLALHCPLPTCNPLGCKRPERFGTTTGKQGATSAGGLIRDRSGALLAQPRTQHLPMENAPRIPMFLQLPGSTVDGHTLPWSTFRRIKDPMSTGEVLLLSHACYFYEIGRMHSVSLHIPDATQLPDLSLPDSSLMGQSEDEFSYFDSKPTEQVTLVQGLTFWLRETCSYGHNGDLDRLTHDRSLYPRTVDQVVILNTMHEPDGLA